MDNTNPSIIIHALKYKWIIISGLSLVIFLLLILFFLQPNIEKPGENPLNIPTPVSAKPSIVSTYPSDNTQNVPAGEIEIILTFNTQITDKSSIKLDFSPQLPFYYKIVDSAPSNTVTAKIYGGLQTNTHYTVKTIRDGQTLYTWGFTTASKPAQSSSGLARDEDQKILDQYYPLAKYLPYNTSDFYIEYQARLTLGVIMKTQDQALIEQGVQEWIRSRGISPSTHKINYVSQ